jgi:uncharacterized protein YjbJ (UPF0337 family)
VVGKQLAIPIKSRRNTMKSCTQDQAEGTFHKIKGKVKEVSGQLSENPSLEAEGIDEKGCRQSSGKDRSGQEGFGEVVI